MIEREWTITTADGDMRVFAARPDGDGPFPLVIQLMDALGRRPELYDHARRVAGMGYFVLAPDLFYRVGLSGPLDIADPETLAKVMAAMNGLTTEMVTCDVTDAVAAVRHDPAAAAGRTATFGFCLGGRLAVSLANALGSKIAAAAAIHPGGLVTAEATSPHRHLSGLQAELYLAIADRDPSATPEQIAELESAFCQNDVHYTVEWYPGALHGFMMPSRADAYDPQAAQRVWECVQDLFRRHLPSGEQQG